LTLLPEVGVSGFRNGVAFDFGVISGSLRAVATNMISAGERDGSSEGRKGGRDRESDREG
jgi:hypothetical protein